MQEGKPVSAHTDALLLERFLAGDQASFEALFERHYSLIYGVLYRLTGTRQEAEDLAQEVFLKLFHNPLRRGDNVSGWLYRVALNMGYNALRAETRRAERERSAGGEHGEAPQPEEVASRHELQQSVRRALARIPERDARLLVLSEMGFSYQELAEIVEVAPGSVGTLLARARKAFLAAYDGGEGHAK
jgi:RNA polymerase sigma-70 factor (ECF subfamily)